MNANTNKKILVFTDAFSGGGAEEVMGFYSAWLRKQFNVIHISKWKGPKEYQLPYWKIALNKPSLIKCIPGIFYILKQYKPDLVLTSTGHNNILFLFLKVFWFTKIKVIIRESSVASVMNNYTFKAKLINALLVKPLYKRANVIIVQSDDMFADLVNKYCLEQSNIIKINNPILNNLTSEIQPASVGSDKIHLLNIGRFSKEKGHFRMLEILHKLPEHYHLRLMGDGLLRMEVEEKVKSLNLTHRVTFLGFQQESEKVKTIAASDLFLQTSFVEGFPNSILQAISLGMPVIAYDVPGGTKEIINNINGKLIADNATEMMLNAIVNTHWNQYDKIEMKEDIEKRFGAAAIMKKLTAVIDETLK